MHILHPLQSTFAEDLQSLKDYSEKNIKCCGIHYYSRMLVNARFMYMLNGYCLNIIV